MVSILRSPEYQAVMSYGGISFAQSRSVQVEKFLSAGSRRYDRGSHLRWLVLSTTSSELNRAFSTGTLKAPDRVSLYSYSFGDASGTNPDDSGSGTWNGVAIGVNAAEEI